jgi:hypothetical protein
MLAGILDTALQVFDPTLYGGSLAAGLFLAILVSLAFGRWLGQRLTVQSGIPPSASVGSLETSVFALLGLLIAFTFSGALSRFDVRRAQAVDEANAIGTAYLRIDLLPAAAQPRLRETFRAYADARPAADLLLLPAVNAMFDITTVRVAATQIHPPTIAYAMLIALALASALLAGYQQAHEKDYDWIHKLGFAAITALTVYVILDIEHPRLGLVQIGAIDQFLVDVRAGMK